MTPSPSEVGSALLTAVHTALGAQHLLRKKAPQRQRAHTKGQPVRAWKLDSEGLCVPSKQDISCPSAVTKSNLLSVRCSCPSPLSNTSSLELLRMNEWRGTLEFRVQCPPPQVHSFLTHTPHTCLHPKQWHEQFANKILGFRTLQRELPWSLPPETQKLTGLATYTLCSG